MMTFSSVLFERLTDDALPLEERLEALVAIVQGDNLDALMALVPLFEECALPSELLACLALALGEWGSIIAVETLIKAFNRETLPLQLRCYVLQGLARTEAPEALECLVEALKHDNNDVFSTAAEQLKQFGVLAIDVLCDVLAAGAPDAQCVAIWQLGELKAPQALGVINRVMSNPDTHLDVLALCVWALGRIGEATPTVLHLLDWALKHAEPEVRVRAQSARRKLTQALN
jgi:hypothetical protein